MRPLTLAILLLVSITAFAQTETFDIATYQPVAGWTKQSTNFAVSFSMIDQAKGAWAQLAIYSSVQSSGNPTTDFSGEWKALVKPDTYAGAVEPSPTTTIIDGWTYTTGTSNFQWQNKKAWVQLTNISGYGVMVSVHLSMNSDVYFKDAERFLQSIQLKKPEQPVQTQAVQQQQQQVAATQTVTPSNNSSTKTITVTDAPGISGITVSTTNFDDGWVAQPFADYVRVMKQPVTVKLHYAIQIDDDMRQADNMATYMWDRLVAARYRSNNLRVFQNEPYTYNRVYFVEGEAIELSTNKNCHVALRVLIYNGTAACVEIVSPNIAAFNKEFPNQEKIESMMNYNKFAVSATDIVGDWTESSSTAVNMYSTMTGAYAGMNTSASANTFNIHSGGTYESNHKGAYGMVGSLTFYDQKYKGKYTLTAWDVTMTNRFEGKTDIYWCQYEAVRGGRVLHLRDKVATAMTYRLVKVK